MRKRRGLLVLYTVVLYIVLHLLLLCRVVSFMQFSWRFYCPCISLYCISLYLFSRHLFLICHFLLYDFLILFFVTYSLMLHIVFLVLFFPCQGKEMFCVSYFSFPVCLTPSHSAMLSTECQWCPLSLVFSGFLAEWQLDLGWAGTVYLLLVGLLITYLSYHPIYL